MTSGFEDWLPPVDRRVKDDAKHTVLLRLRSRREARFALASAGLLAAGVAGIRASSDATGPNGFWAVAGMVATFYGLVATIVWTVAAVSWSRDHRSVRTTGWRRGTVRVASLETGHRRNIVSMLVEYDDGSAIRLRSGNPGTKVSSLFSPSGPPVLVGGTGRRMVVLVRTSVSGPVLFQVAADTYRWLPE
jgi:hypothetical protein